MAAKSLRVSRYFGDDDRPPRFRFSIWSGESADAAVSRSNEEASRPAQFISQLAATRKPILDEIRASLRL
jgi:hypothetical protein